MRSVFRFGWISLSAWLVGCQVTPPPDPNEPALQGAQSGRVLLHNVSEAARGLDQRVASGQLTVVERDKALQNEVKRLLNGVKVEKVPDREAWEYGDAFRLADDWEVARSLYERAVRTAANEDRRINDSLRLARAQAHLGEVVTAIATVRTTFASKPQDKAPILMATLYEVVPEAERKGQDAALARLLEDAIRQHQAAIVDPKSRAGSEFLAARPLHVRNAWVKAVRLYEQSGKTEDARRAVLEMDRSASQSGRF